MGASAESRVGGGKAEELEGPPGLLPLYWSVAVPAGLGRSELRSAWQVHI
jgi:hypothetical protein